MHLALRWRASGGLKKKKRRRRQHNALNSSFLPPPPPLSLSLSRPQICKTKTNKNNTVEGVLKGYDQLLNLVLDEAIEFQRSAEDLLTVTDESRPLGLVVCRGTAVMAVAPTAGAEVMASNPFLSAAAEEGGDGGAAAGAGEAAEAAAA